MKTNDDNIFVNPEPDQPTKDPETGKTISRKRAFVIAGGAMMAGAAFHEGLQKESAAEILLDSDGDGVADTILSDANADGIYEVSGEISEDLPETEDTLNQGFNPNTAPMASPGTVTGDMSFTEAFAAARGELGPGGVFSWQGQYYNTFYEEELNENNQPIVHYETADHHSLPSLNDSISSGEVFSGMDQTSIAGGQGFQPNVMAADLNSDGNIDAVFVDLNQDGSADIMYADFNEDSQITENEYIVIHDPATLEIPEIPADPSMMSVDLNADGIDDILLGDLNSDQVADFIGVDENQDTIIDESEVTIISSDFVMGFDPPEIRYSGEIAADMPSDVSDEMLDQMSDDLSSLEDNFDEINEWT
jgi:hypothetical protein